MLVAEDVAKEYQRTEGWRRFESARDLVTDIDRYKTSKGLSRTSISSLDIAEHVLRLQAQPVVTEAEAAAWLNDLQQGIGDRGPELDELALAQHVAGLDMKAYAAEREMLGTYKSTAAFLLGQ
jgi:hypothetical protein